MFLLPAVLLLLRRLLLLLLWWLMRCTRLRALLVSGVLFFICFVACLFPS
jgi:hypothetical protein